MQQVDSVYAFLNNRFGDVCVANGTIEISIYIQIMYWCLSVPLSLYPIMHPCSAPFPCMYKSNYVLFWKCASVFRTHFTKEHTLDRKETNTFFLQFTFSIRCVEKLFALKCSLKWTTPAASLSSNVIFIRFYLLVEMRSLQVPNVSPVNLWLHFCPKSKDFSAPLPRVLDLKWASEEPFAWANYSIHTDQMDAGYIFTCTNCVWMRDLNH